MILSRHSFGPTLPNVKQRDISIIDRFQTLSHGNAVKVTGQNQNFNCKLMILKFFSENFIN